MGWISKLFNYFSGPPEVVVPEKETYSINITFKDNKTRTIFLKRERMEDIEYPIQGNMGTGAWANYHTLTRKLIQYKYWCECGTELSDGPRGGCAVSAVCAKCRINFGADLPGFWGH